MRTEPPTATIPGVEGGVLLAFPCPNCRRWAKPAYEPACHHYACVLCGAHVEPALLGACYATTREHMPRDLRYEQEAPPPSP